MLWRLEPNEPMARDRLPKVEENSTLSPPELAFALELELLPDLWMS
jgi:hypothetical protein